MLFHTYIWMIHQYFTHFLLMLLMLNLVHGYLLDRSQLALEAKSYRATLSPFSLSFLSHSRARSTRLLPPLFGLNP